MMNGNPGERKTYADFGLTKLHASFLAQHAKSAHQCKSPVD
jgi:hypothetical protein